MCKCMFQIPKYNIENKTHTNHGAIFLKHVLVVCKCFLLFQMASCIPRLFWYLNHLLTRLLQLGNSGTIAPPKRANEKKNEKKV